MMRRALLASATVLPVALIATGATSAPAIRMNDANRVPACVTPERLMAFLAERNERLDPRFANIAAYYKYYGEGWRVRWDYAFYQMAIETNFLKFRRGDGSRGDVRETQNNFAGIGATGGGVPGERFRDVETGVHAQIQHLVAYSGEQLVNPVAKRTREQQSGIIKISLRLGRPVTFGDLARRWATDRSYAKSIDFIANLFSERYCTGAPVQASRDSAPPAPRPVQRRRELPFPPPSGLGGPKPSEIEDQPADIEIAAEAEELPWLAKPQAPVINPKSTSERNKSRQRERVKTIWSRGDADGPFNPGPPPPAVQNGASRKSKTAIEPSPAKKSEATGTAASAKAESSSAQTADPAKPSSALPAFKINPESGATPSRLGGPVPDIRPAPMKNTSPQTKACTVLTASYGGKKTLLLRSEVGGETQLTALTVLDGFEKSMFETYRRSVSPAAEIVGEYADKDAALADARANCPAN